MEKNPCWTADVLRCPHTALSQTVSCSGRACGRCGHCYSEVTLSRPPPLHLVPSCLGERVGGVPLALLRKEAVYNAVAVAAYELHDYVDWSQWLRSALLQVRGGRGFWPWPWALTLAPGPDLWP